MTQPDYHPKIQDFLTEVRKKGSYAVVGSDLEERRAFIPLSTLEAYFETPSGLDKLREILVIIFHPDEIPVFVEPDNVRKK